MRISRTLDKVVRRKSINSMDVHYKFIKTLGQGSYGKVKLAEDLRTGEKVAIKVIQKSKLRRVKDFVRVEREIKLMSLLKHPNIVNMKELLNLEDQYLLVLEYAPGGELFDYIVARGRVKEKQARVFFRQIISAMGYCHKNFIIHRDLKPENLLLDENAQIKIIDFGFANAFNDTELLSTFCGSPGYAPPEMIRGEEYLGAKSEIWSLGVILFALTCGKLPFDGATRDAMFKKIVKGNFEVPFYISPECNDLLNRMIVVNPDQRASLDEVARHPWMLIDHDGPPDYIMPHREPVEEPDEAHLDRLAEMGLDIEAVRGALANRDNNILSCAYYLSVEKTAIEAAEAADAASATASASSEPRERKRASRQALGLETISESAPKSSRSSRRASRGRTSAERARAEMAEEVAAVDLGKVDVPKAYNRKSRRHSIQPNGTLPIDNLEDAMAEARASRRDRKRDKSKGKAKKAKAKAKAKGKDDDDGADASPDAADGAEDAATPMVLKLNPGRDQRRKRKKFSLDAAKAAFVSGVSGSRGSTKLRKVKGPFSVATTSTKPAEEIFQIIESALGERGISYTRAGAIYEISWADDHGNPLQIEIEVCIVSDLKDLHGLRLKRVAGESFAYKRRCLQLLYWLRL